MLGKRNKTKTPKLSCLTHTSARTHTQSLFSVFKFIRGLLYSD